jgi:tetratricopeptide (TPR) repeat protein
MKRILDRLMARQRKLLQNLEPPRQVSRLSAEVLAERRATEERAIEAAFEKLATGDILAATSLLEPHVDGAQDTRTLTTLSRIRSASGRFDEALELLQRAEALDPTDNKVAFFLAELLQLMGRHQDAIPHRRRIAFTTREATAASFLGLIATIVKASSGKPTLAAELRVALAGLRKAPDVTARHLAEAARLIYSIDAMSADAIALHAEGDPRPEDHVESTFAWLTLPAWCVATGRAADRIGEEGEPGRRPSAVEMDDVTVHPALQWIPILDQPAPSLISGLAPGRIRLRNEDLASPLLMANTASAVLRLPRTPRQFDQLALLLGGNGGYYHDLIEYISVLAIAERLGLDRDLPLVVNENPAPHMMELLSLLGYENAPLIQVGRNAPARFNKLLITTRLAAGGRWFDPMLSRWYRQRLVEPLSPPGAARKLYLSRAGTTRRRLANEPAVFAALEPLGFELVRPETVSVRDQIALFAQASHIVGSSGAAFTNMIFAPPGARVVVLQNKQLVQGGGDLYFDVLASSCGHRAATLECEPARLAPGERSVDADLMADVDALLRCLT